jgi:WD40 repeat protein
MLTQQKIRVSVATLTLAISTTLLLPSRHEKWWAVAAEVQPSQTQQRSPVPAQEKFTTHLFDLSGKKHAQFAGEMYRFSPDGKRLLTQSSSGFSRYYLFDFSGKKLLQFEGNEVEFSPNGKRILVKLGGKTFFELYDTTGKKLAQLPGQFPGSVMFSQNGQQIVTFTDSGAYLFDTSGRQIAQMQGQFFNIASGFDSSGKGLILNQLVLTKPYSPICNLFNSSGQAIARLPGGCVGISSKGQRFLLVTGTSENPLLYLYDFSGKKFAQLSGLLGIFSPDEQYILTMDSFSSTSSYLYNLAGKEIAQLQGITGRFSPNGKRLVTASYKTLHLYDVSGKEIAQLPGDRAAFLPKGERIATFLFGKNEQKLDVSNGESRLFDTSGRELALLKGDFDITHMVMYGAGNVPPFFDDIYTYSFPFFSADGQRLATSDSKSSYLYNSSGKLIAKLPGVFPRFSPTGQYLVTVSEDKIYVFDHSGTKVIETQGRFGGFSPDGQHIAIVAKRTIP